MAMFKVNQIFTSQEIENIVLRIQREYQTTNVRFVEQSNHFCVYRGIKDGVEYFYKFNKNNTLGFILYEEIV